MGGWGGLKVTGYFGRIFFHAFLKCTKFALFQKIVQNDQSSLQQQSKDNTAT